MSDELASCPVCGAEVTRTPRTPSVGFRGRRWFFCSPAERPCLMTFKRAPERFADAHPDAGVTTRSPTLPPPTTRRSPFTVLRDAHAEDDADDSISDG